MAKSLNKSEIYTNVVTSVTELLESSKTTKAFRTELLSILEINLAPKSSGSINPPILNDEGEIVEAYCRFHQRYEKVEDMVISNGKSKGYCKAGISRWNKNQTKVKSLDSEALAAMTDGDFDTAQAKALEAKETKESLTYDYDADWAEFTK